MNSKVNLVISFAEMLQKIVSETENTDYIATYETATNALAAEDGSITIFDVAYDLQQCDNDKPVLKPVLEYLKTVYQIGIDEGNPICMNNMGSLYYMDRCGMKSYKKAAKYYEMAAKTGYPIAAENLGYIYYYGFDTEIDYEKAYKYFSIAALQGREEATYKIGDMFRYGYYVDKSDKAACILYHKAHEISENNSECKCVANIYKRLGDIYSEGIGEDEDPCLAMLYYQSAEVHFYKQIKAGDPFVWKDLEFVIKTQNKLRKKVAKSLPTGSLPA